MISRPIGIFFCLLPLYWAYLVFSTHPVVIFDAVGYERLGRLLLDQGWAGYFTALNREPLFPLVISWAMGLERAFSVPYPIFLKCLLMIFLSVTMVGTYRLTRLLGAGRTAAALAALYVGISPDILNSTLWLWSEAAAYPWVVGIVFVSIKLWRMIRNLKPWRNVATCSLVLAILFFILTMVKAIAAMVLVFYFIPFYLAFFCFAFQRQWGKLGRTALAVVVVLVLMGVGVHGYKCLNLHANGQYELTDRGDFALFGNTVRRLQPMTRERVVQALLSVPRLGLCERVYGNECAYWTYLASDFIIEKVRKDLTAMGLSANKQSEFYIAQSLELMAQHPFQECFFMAVEASKMLFWENRLYFVQYPPLLDKVYSHPIFIYLLCFSWAVFSLLGVVYAAFHLLGCLFRKGSCGNYSKDVVAWLFVLGFIVCFSGLYSIFFIDMRYALPIAPLFVALFVAGVSRVYVRMRHNVR